MTILVTGGCGFLGQTLLSQLCALDRTVVSYDRRAREDDDRGGLRYVQGDLNDLPLLLETIERFSVTEIIHTAAISHPFFSREIPYQTVVTNALGTTTVFEAARLKHIRHIVNFSSECAYGYKSDNAMKMIRELSELREDGKPFNLKTAAGESVTVTPFQACRGHLSLFNPGKHGNDQYYHWDVVLFPDEVGAANLTPAEAEWIVLWTQGLSEEGGGRMKTYSYTVEAAKMLAGSILSSATMGAGGAAGNAAAAAGASLASAFSHIAAAEAPGIIAQATAKATANAATLHGVNWVASTIFDRADKWAFERMSKLGMDPRTGLELQLRLVQAGAVHNGLLFDEHRLEQINQLVASLPENPQEQTAQNQHATADMKQAGTKDAAAASVQ